MPLQQETKQAIHNYLLVELTRFVKESSAKEQLKAQEALTTRPFHARLVPTLFTVSLSKHSFYTRSGLWWQQVAQLVGRQYHKRAELGFQVVGQIKPAASSSIEEILSQLNAPGMRSPNRSADIAEVQTGQYIGGDSIKVRADLFILKYDGQELYFEMKTPEPNKDTCIAMKRFILRTAAMKKGSQAEAFAATAYNLYGDGQPYTWNYALQFLEIGADMLIGRAFWEKIGDSNTYDELLQISEEVGSEITEIIAAL
jgi:hypothetical protein